MRKLIGVGFLVFLVNIGILIVIYKNAVALRGIPNIDIITLFIGILALIGFIVMFKGIHFAMRKRGLTK